MITSPFIQGQSSIRRRHVWIAFVASALGTLWNILGIAGDRADTTHPYAYVTHVFGALAAFSVWVVALGVKNQLATVTEAKVAIGLVIVWLVTNMTIYYDDLRLTIIMGIVVLPIANQWLLIVTYAYFPFFCLWMNRKHKKQALLKEAAKITEREEQI